MDSNFKEKVQNYLTEKLELGALRVVSIYNLAGGISRTTIGVDTVSVEEGVQRKFILQMDDQQESLVERRRKAEYDICSRLFDVPGIPVAPVFCEEEDPEPLGAPFMLAGFLPGTSKPAELIKPGNDVDGSKIARESFTILGRLASIDPTTLRLSSAITAPKPAEAWRNELDTWERALRQNPVGALPTTSAAIRHLHRQPPPPASKHAVVHGDYRLGNYLFAQHGITGILDWEMVHLGDPLEDLAWALLPNWRFAASRDKIAGALSPEEAILIWESASGLRADPAAFAWWTLLSHVKAIALWATARHVFLAGRSSDLKLAAASYGYIAKQEQWMLEQMRAELI